jgi:arsenite-transporting ATPase
MDATGAYHRQVLRDSSDGPGGRVVTPLMRLQNADYSRIILVTLAETTPVSEAAALQEDLRRARIEPFAWVINQSLAATGTRDPVLALRAAAEREQIERVRKDLAPRLAIVPWAPTEPVGPAALEALLAPSKSGDIAA